MGNKNEKTQQKNQTFNSEIKHPKLSLAKVIKPLSQNQQPYLQTTQSVQNKQIFEKWKLRILKYSVDTNQIQTILVPRSVSFEEKGICGSSGIIRSQYVMLPYVLSEEIDNRAVLKQPFLEKQLWYLIYILNVAGSTAHSRNLILGDVRPHNVLMSFDGQICVCCLQTFLDEQKNYTKTMRLKTKTYLAPQQIKDLQQGKSQPSEDERTSQSFSIGLTALSAIVLKDLSYLYGNDFTFNEKALNNQKLNMRSRTQYSDSLKNLIESVLLVDFRQRLKCLQVVQILKPYEQQIINLEEFQIQNSQYSSQRKGNSNNVDVSPHALKSSRQIQLAKVINNNDYNKSSRVKYQNRNNQLSKVINNSDLNRNSRVRYNISPNKSQNPQYQQSKFQQFPTVNPNKIQQGPPPTQIQQFQPQLQPQLQPQPQSQPQTQTQHQPQPQTQPVPHSLSNNHGPIIMTESLYTHIPNFNGQQPPQGLYNHIQNQKPVQSRVIQSTSQNKSQFGLMQRTGQTSLPASYIAPPNPMQFNKYPPNQQPNQLVYQNPFQGTTQTFTQVNTNQIPTQYMNVPPNLGFANIHTAIKSPEVSSYISKFDSNIGSFEPKQPITKPQTKNIQTYLWKTNNLYTKPQPPLQPNLKQINQASSNIGGESFMPLRGLQEIREVNSIKPPERLYQTYEEAMKNIDHKLRQSKRMFPDDS